MDATTPLPLDASGLGTGLPTTATLPPLDASSRDTSRSPRLHTTQMADLRHRPQTPYTRRRREESEIPSSAGSPSKLHDGSPLTQGNELVLYEPQPSANTRSVAQRLQQAKAGDLGARLKLVPLEEVERQLAQTFRKDQRDCSFLSYLQQPGDGVLRSKAASTLLEELVEEGESTAKITIAVYRYIQEHALWKDHPNGDIQSADDLISTLDGRDNVRISLMIGTSADMSKRNSIEVINNKWGDDWFKLVPPNMRDDTWSRPEGCSKRLLINIRANCEQGLSFQEAVERWKTAVFHRTDLATRQRLRLRSSKSPILQPDDVRSANRPLLSHNEGRRPIDLFCPNAKEDNLRIELIPPPATDKPVSQRALLDYASARLMQKKLPRRRTAVAKQLPDVEGRPDNVWRKSDKGRVLKQRKGFQIIYKPNEDYVSHPDSSLPV